MFEMIGRTALIALGFYLMNLGFRFEKEPTMDQTAWSFVRDRPWIMVLLGFLVIGFALGYGIDPGDCSTGWDGRGAYADC